MATIIVSAFVTAVFEALRSAALKEIGVIWGLQDDLQSLESVFCTIQLVLQDAEIKQRKSPTIQNWLLKLKDVAYDAEDVLDRIATFGLRRRADSERGVQHKLTSFLSGDGVVENRFGETSESRETSSVVNKSEIYGRDEEKEMIIRKLVDGMHDQDHLSVYAILGMGGLGKITLAQIAYKDDRVKRHFDLQIWICVSDNFSVKRLLQAIIQSIDGDVCNITDLDPLQCHLQERLQGRRFLLVLDDVWNENHVAWDELKEVLRCGSKGSVLLVTTRIEKVALMMATIDVHHIGYLSEENSWSLFRQRAFTNGVEDESHIAIGKAIVKKCGGVPLAIKALGSLMRFKSHESEWLAIKQSEIWQLSDDENEIFPVLRLSYYNLAPQMRQCFAYCCLFPKDHIMEEKQLIQLWMANGFVPSQGQRDLYFSGHLIFKELIWRSFLQDVRINSEGNVTCKMHDLMHDLAVSIMKHETCVLESDKVMDIPTTLRHLSFDFSSISEILRNPKFPGEGSLRSLICHERFDYMMQEFSSSLSKQQNLRAFHIKHWGMQKWLNRVYKFEHLRYLGMSCYGIKRLPESLTRLHNLQTLKLMNSEELLELPRGLKVMKNLYFLEIESFDSLLCTPPGLGDLIYLRELSIFIVGQDASHQIDQLKELNLGGSLCIGGLENVSNTEDAKNANLMMKNNLTLLGLLWTDGAEETHSTEYYEELLQGLRPHHNLEVIGIASYQGVKFPNWMSALALKNLKKVSLGSCRKCEHLPPLGKLPSLTDLILDGMDSLKYLDDEWCVNGEILFPVLTTLSIFDTPNLEEFRRGNSVESFACLKEIEIVRCPKLLGLPFLPTLRSLVISGSISATLLRSLTFLTSLTSLKLSDIAELAAFPEGFLQNNNALEELKFDSLPITTLSDVLDDLSALKVLHLYRCNHLEFLPEGLKNLGSLETLDISGCDGLRLFPAATMEHLSSIRFLSFNNCKKLKPFSGPMKQTTALHQLYLHGLPELKDLPESMQLFSALQWLFIWGCEGLWSLPDWLGNLESLSALGIRECENLSSLPDGFKSLRSLEIVGCPELKKRWSKAEGEYWPKISHIPNVIML
ncbi:UNVERIFIED_CONTAM: putative disease resistance protein RGA1 [Sesamum radiatum]|uniref:Disease resistance protein RGA1 n=1 Tax=Sesamum radiatum TaxID=300843 RepID=A0AAW2VSW7_SESRA